MLTEGRTNREIATELFVSHRTVGSHVSNLLGKLGARTRSEAAARSTDLADPMAIPSHADAFDSSPPDPSNTRADSMRLEIDASGST